MLLSIPAPKYWLMPLLVCCAWYTSPCWSIELIGNVKSKAPQLVVAEVAGVIQQAEAETGARIAKGSHLATIKAEDFTLALRRYKANLALANADLNIKQSRFHRYKELLTKNSLSQHELDVAQAELDAALASVELARTDVEKAQLDLAHTNIYSQIDGYVVARHIETGTWVEKGTLLYKSTNIDKVVVRLLASEFDLKSLSVGLPIAVWSEANPGHRVTANINRISVEPDPATHAYPIEIEITNPDHQFKPGMSIHASTSTADYL